MNDQLVMIAAPTLALITFQMSPSEASLIVTAEWLPALIFSGLAGRVADRFERRKVLGVTGLIAAAALGMMCLATLVDPSMHFSFLFAAVSLYAFAGVVAGVTSGAFVPVLATRTPVPDALSMQVGLRSFARIIGQAAAGPLTQFFGAVVALVSAAAMAVVGSAAVVSMQAEQPARNEDRAAIPFSPWRAVIQSSMLRAMTVLAFMMNLGGAIIQGAFFAFAYRALDLSPFAVGAMLFLGAVSAVAAAPFTRYLLKRWPARRLCAAGGVAAAGAVWLIPVASLGAPLATLMCYEVIFSASATVFVISFAVVRQAMVPNSQLGQLIAVSSTVGAAAMVLGTVISALTLAPLGLHATIVLGCLVSSLGVMCMVGLSRFPQVAVIRSEIIPGANDAGSRN